MVYSEFPRDSQKIKIEAHKRWLDSDGKEGARATFVWHYLSNQIFKGADLRRADFNGADLVGADFNNANLRKCIFEKARLNGADLSDADLSDADLSDADLSDADLRGAILNSVSLKGALLEKTDFRDATISNVLIDSIKSLEDSRLNSLDGFVFLDEERQKRQERTEQIFDIDDKGTVSFSLPENFNPIKVAKALMLVSAMIEGVRLCYTVDDPSPLELASVLQNPELWGAEQDKYAANIEVISKESPIKVILTIVAGVGLFIWQIGEVTAHFYDINQRTKVEMEKLDLERKKFGLEKWKAQTEFQFKVQEQQEKRQERLIKAKPTPEVFKEYYADNKELMDNLHMNLHGTVDQPEVRAGMAFDVVSGFQHRWLDLVPKGWPPPEINGQPMPMPSDDYEPEK